MKLYRYLTGPDESAFCHRVTAALNSGWDLHGPPSMTYDAGKGIVMCGQAVTKDVGGMTYSAEMKLSDY